MFVCERERESAREKDSHLLPAKDQPLLHGRDALFLLDAFLYAGDLTGEQSQDRHHVSERCRS